jgi:GNAT superfamily N-acetyltransferase
MQLLEVTDKRGWRLFHRVPRVIYKKDPNWICPLEADVRSVFDPKLNKTFDQGEAVCFVLRDYAGKLVGRIAAFIDHERNRTQPYPVGGIGFFECVDNRNYAFALFDKAVAWLRQRGAQAVDGPVNFGERDKYWGLLVQGFFPPLFQENYHPPYYRAFFEAYGFVPFEQILTFKGDTSNIPVERLARIAARMKERYNLTTEKLDYAKLDKYAQDFCEAYNAAFNQFGHFKPMLPEQIIGVLKQIKGIVDPNIMAMAYCDGKPAGFCALFPDINPFLKAAKGKLNWFTLPGFLLRRRFAKTFDAKGIGFGIHPQYRSKGVFAIILDFMTSEENRRRYPWMYLTTIRAHNQDAIGAYENLVVEVDRVHLAYRKALAAEVEIKPFPFMVEV